MDHRACAGIAVTADRLIMIEAASGEGSHSPHLIGNRTTFGTSDLDDVGPGSGAVIPADGLVVAERAAGNSSGRVKFSVDSAP